MSQSTDSQDTTPTTAKQEQIKNLISNNDFFNLICSYNSSSIADDQTDPTAAEGIHTIAGIQDMNLRVKHMGGKSQQDRMIRDKRRTLSRAVLYSYQAALIKKMPFDTSLLMSDELERIKKPFRALINPNKLKQDYDDKILSVGFEAGFKTGDIFNWVGTNTNWLIYLQDLTELAYFRGEIRRCSYEISWQDDEGNSYTTYAAVRGPVETRLNSSIVHDISLDNPNYSLHILLPKNDKTVAAFARYKKFYMKNNSTCWRVEAVDTISTPNILEFDAVEYYSNKDTDDIENGIVDGLVVKETDPNPESTAAIIKGETFIIPKQPYTYQYKGSTEGSWNLNGKLPITATVDPNDANKITIIWNAMYSGQFDLKHGDEKKTIVVQSLF